jgi:hypothetical protein
MKRDEVDNILFPGSFGMLAYNFSPVKNFDYGLKENHRFIQSFFMSPCGIENS